MEKKSDHLGAQRDAEHVYLLICEHDGGLVALVEADESLSADLLVLAGVGCLHTRVNTFEVCDFAIEPVCICKTQGKLGNLLFHTP